MGMTPHPTATNNIVDLFNFNSTMIRNQLVGELSNSTISAESLSWWLRYGNVDIYDFHNM